MTVTTTPGARQPAARSILVVLYGTLAYALGVAGVGYLIAVTLGPVSLGGGPVRLEATGARVGFDLALVALFGLQHAVMARSGFKERLTRALPRGIERATFTLVSGLLLGAVLWLWQPVDLVLWSAQRPALRAALLACCALGWTYQLVATFSIDHFQLFGLRQVWRDARGLEPSSTPFQERLLYRFDRHPIMTGMLVGLWVTPDLTLDRLLLAGAFTVYIVIGVTMEERALVAEHGERYLEYARRVGTLVPRITRLQ